MIRGLFKLIIIKIDVAECLFILEAFNFDLGTDHCPCYGTLGFRELKSNVKILSFPEM